MLFNVYVFQNACFNLAFNFHKITELVRHYIRHWEGKSGNIQICDEQIRWYTVRQKEKKGD
jgi:hypothetical protein